MPSASSGQHTITASSSSSFNSVSTSSFKNAPRSQVQSHPCLPHLSCVQKQGLTQVILFTFRPVLRSIRHRTRRSSRSRSQLLHAAKSFIQSNLGLVRRRRQPMIVNYRCQPPPAQQSLRTVVLSLFHRLLPTLSVLELAAPSNLLLPLVLFTAPFLEARRFLASRLTSSLPVAGVKCTPSSGSSMIKRSH